MRGRRFEPDNLLNKGARKGITCVTVAQFKRFVKETGHDAI